MVVGVRAILPPSVPLAPPRDARAVDKDRTTTTAPAPIAPVERTSPPQYFNQRPAAPFLAQLIATRQSLPQTRARNRAEPREGAAAYGDFTRMIRRTADR
jgi:hypothetical protein